MIVFSKGDYFYFNIGDTYLDWDCIRLIWIAFYKNGYANKNSQCHFAKLPIDLIKVVIEWVGDVRLNEKNKSRCILLQ